LQKTEMGEKSGGDRKEKKNVTRAGRTPASNPVPSLVLPKSGEKMKLKQIHQKNSQKKGGHTQAGCPLTTLTTMVT
jgi:hypothetical protein